MKRYIKILSAIAAIMAITLSVKPALAYFTTYTEAKGNLIVHLGDQTEIQESFGEWTKHITVTNKKTSDESVYVRATAYAPTGYSVAYSGSGWTMNADGYWYYDGTVAPGDSTSPLDATISGIPAEALKDDSFNVVVVYECVPVQTDEKGNIIMPPADANWDIDIDTGN